MIRTHYTPGASAAHGPFCCCREHRPQLHQQERTMEKLSDEEIRNIIADDGEKYWTAEKRMAIELRDLRAQRAASRERVREVVERAVADWLALNCAPSSTMADVQVASAVMGKAIAARVADAIAAPQPRDDRRPLPPEVMTGALQDTVHEDAGPGRPARSVRVAGALDAARVRETIAGVALAEMCRYLGCGGGIEEGTRAWQTIQTIAARSADQLAGQAVALSSEELRGLQLMSLHLDEGGHDWSHGTAMADVRSARALLDRLIATPGQGARPSVARIQPGPTASAVDSALCRRLASDAAEDDGRMSGNQWTARWDPMSGSALVEDESQVLAEAQLMDDAHAIARTRNNLPEVARQLTAAADLRDAFYALMIVAKDAQDQLIEERDSERRHSARLAEAFEEATGKLAVAVTAKENAEHDLEAEHRELAALKERNAALLHAVDDAVATLGKVETERDAARAECERLRDERDGLQKYGDTWAAAAKAWQHDLELARDRIRAMLATEPAVSEERCAEIGRVYDVASPVAVPVRLLAATRQLHALRAGLREIAGGEPAPQDLAPKTCPRCGRSAHFRYANAAEAAKQSPICWGESESDCPGMPPESVKEVTGFSTRNAYVLRSR